jgi:glycosyltransferase involved in cell wall biosynthesis
LRATGRLHTVLFIVNVDALARAAREQGYEVHVATSITNPANAQLIRDASLVLHVLPDIRTRTGIFSDLRFCAAVVGVLRRVRPDIAHLVTVKPIVYGGLITRLFGRVGVVSAIPGLGYAFVANGLWARLRRRFVMLGYRLSLRNRRQRVIFQNREDMQLFLDHGIVRAGDAVLIRGSGVDLREFTPVPEPAGVVRVVMASRLLREKGVIEFLHAARALEDKGVRADFLLVGDVDRGNPGSLTADELKDALKHAPVEWIGFRRDMSRVLTESHVVCLPTYYGEGVPKVLIEAAACGRPAVTTDIPGCRDVVRHGQTGLLVPPRDVAALEDALRTLIEDAQLRVRMGAAARKLAEREFGLEGVITSTLNIYVQLLRTEAPGASISNAR